MRADRERQAVAIHNRHDFHTFSALGRRHFGSATLGHREGRIDKAFFFVERSTFAKFVGDVRQDSTQYLAAAPRLETTMHRFVVRITLRQHVPLRAGVENPQHAACVLTESGKPWRSTIAMIFIPFPRLVGATSAPPPLAIAKVASMKHSSSSSAPRSRSSLAMSVKTPRSTSLRHHAWKRRCTVL